MTSLATALTSAAVAVVLAAAGVLGSFGGSSAVGAGGAPRTALVVDASVARDGRDLIDPRLRALGAELRVARSPAEAETDVRYLAARGYRVEAAGPLSSAAAQDTGVASPVKTP